MDTNNYEAKVYSFTKEKEYIIKVSKKFINKNDNILIIDDFLASGSAMIGLMSICEQSGANIQGVGVVIEKGFQGGRELIENKGIQLESLAIVEDMRDGQVIFRE